MNKENFFIGTLLTGAAAAVLLLGFSLFTQFDASVSPQQSTLGAGAAGGPTGNGGATRFTNIPNNTSIVCGSSTQAVATSTARNYVTLVNDSANTVYFTEGVPASSTASIGIRLNANGGSYEINALNLYTGALYCAANASSTVDEVINQ